MSFRSSLSFSLLAVTALHLPLPAQAESSAQLTTDERAADRPAVTGTGAADRPAATGEAEPPAATGEAEPPAATREAEPPAATTEVSSTDAPARPQPTTRETRAEAPDAEGQPAKGAPAQAGPASGQADADALSVEDAEAAARQAYHRGDRLYFEGDYAGALAAFEESYALSGRIEMMFNLANAHERLGHYAQAGMALRSYIPHAQADARPALRKRAERLDQLAESQHNAVAQPVREPHSIPVSRAIGIGLTGVGVLGLGVGTAFGIAAMLQREQLDDLCQTGSSGRLCPPDADPALEKDETFSAVSDISFIVGGVAAISGVYLILSSRKKDTELSARLGPSSLHLQGTF